MQTNVPRILLAGTNSGCGKTTAVCALLQALVNRGVKTGAMKCGPDYIDPMFHSRIIGAESGNLDAFFYSENTMNYLLSKHAGGKDVTVLEGVMGYYDGIGLDSSSASTYQVARLTHTPVVLVVGAAGAALSVLAVIQGFLDFLPDNQIRGVILNRCSPMAYAGLAKAIRQHFGGRIQPLGYLPNLPQCSLESRHLGLVTAAEVENLHQKLAVLAEQAEKSLDLPGLLALAASAEPISCQPVTVPQGPPVRIAVAKDRAFCFYYGENLQLLQELGAQLAYFSPLTDSALPEDVDGLYLGGGYPELYARQLAENVSLRKKLRQALEDGLPCLAECGGFMYLCRDIAGEPMVDFLPGRCYDNGRLTRFGYVTLETQQDSLFGPAGMTIPAHEFHRWDATDTGEAFLAQKPSGRSWQCAFVNQRLYAGFPHIPFYANPETARNFYEACRKERLRHAGNSETGGY